MLRSCEDVQVMLRIFHQFVIRGRWCNRRWLEHHTSHYQIAVMPAQGCPPCVVARDPMSEIWEARRILSYLGWEESFREVLIRVLESFREVLIRVLTSSHFEQSYGKLSPSHIALFLVTLSNPAVSVLDIFELPKDFDERHLDVRMFLMQVSCVQLSDICDWCTLTLEFWFS